MMVITYFSLEEDHAELICGNCAKKDLRKQQRMAGGRRDVSRFTGECVLVLALTRRLSSFFDIIFILVFE